MNLLKDGRFPIDNSKRIHVLEQSNVEEGNELEEKEQEINVLNRVLRNKNRNIQLTYLDMSC